MNPKEWETLKQLITTTSEPLLIKNYLNWELLQWDLQKWENILGNEPLTFRQGKNSYTKEPQFENTTDSITMTFKDFLKNQEEKPEQWLYFDYKYLKDWLLNKSELRQHISWKEFGLTEYTAENSTIWIGNKGAHTPCHVDTYGCNLIAQIYGRKRWLLFPPTEDLKPTRIPYEESSIYSKINLFSPSLKDVKNLNSCRMITLNPGDVLVLPHRWWHYVENLELAISINTWISLPIDFKERIGESIALTLISQLTKDLKKDHLQNFINPFSNPQETIPVDLIHNIELTDLCVKQYEDQSDEYSEFADMEKTLDKFKNIAKLDKLSDNEMEQFLMTQKERFIKDELQNVELVSKSGGDYTLRRFMDVALHPDVINLIMAKLIIKSE